MLGRSAIYLQGRYEVQVLDSYMHPLDGANDYGAIYELKNADVNASLPPENWRTYEITVTPCATATFGHRSCSQRARHAGRNNTALIKRARCAAKKERACPS